MPTEEELKLAREFILWCKEQGILKVEVGCISVVLAPKPPVEFQVDQIKQQELEGRLKQFQDPDENALYWSS